MQTRGHKRPTLYREQNPPNRRGISTPGPLRFAAGKRKGEIVPTRPNPVKEIDCNRCGLPSYPGLMPFRLALGFDPKTGDAIDVYVHEKCPADVAMARKFIDEDRARLLEAENKKRSWPYGTARKGPKGLLKASWGGSWLDWS